MTVLVINDDMREEIARVRDHALTHPFNVQQVELRNIDSATSPGCDERFTCLLPKDYRCVFSIDSNRAGKTFRHLSVSIATKGRYPSPLAVNVLMKEFGFTKSLKECCFWTEEEFEAVNVIEPIYL